MVGVYVGVRVHKNLRACMPVFNWILVVFENTQSNFRALLPPSPAYASLIFSVLLLKRSELILLV